MKKMLELFYLIVIAALYLLMEVNINESIMFDSNTTPYSFEDGDNPIGRLEQENLMLMDPKTKQIPNDILTKERNFIKSISNREIKTFNKKIKSTKAITWIERGPNNIGGRTRALGIDVRTETSPNITIIAGGVSGGIWKSTDDGVTWTEKTLPGQLHNATCIVQDKRSGHEDTWYVGSGEGLGNSASQGSAFFRGDGIFKSTDNGESWSVLAATSTGDPEYDNNFDYVSTIDVDPTNGDIYACASSQIYKSSDGGTSWIQKTNNNVPYPTTPGDIQITSSGIIYTAITNYNDGLSNASGVRRSSDGGSTWTDISSGVTDFPSSIYRGVVGISPSNPNVVYFLIFSFGTLTGGSTNHHQLWKYTYNSGDGSGVGGSWENRGGNLPDHAGGDLNGNDPFDTQSGYDMLLQVKPDNENFVILGGTNLYYSDDGFATSGNFVRIGGYAAYNTYAKYTNHHPDIHSGAFRPGSNIVYYSGNDGGIQRTNDVAASTVSWTSLNNSFNVTQFYSVTQAPEPTSNIIIGGAQDNGSLYGNSAGASSWTDISSGDGTFSNVAPIADDRYYLERQRGYLYRVTRSNTYFTSITPNGSSNRLFVNPFVRDKNNSSILYYAGGNNDDNTAHYSGVWRNTDAINATTTTGWSYLTSTAVSNASATYERVSALGVSDSNSANVLYYGTSKGNVKKIDNSDGASYSVIDVTNASFPSNAYVSCIAVDPTNSNKAIVTFSNYNVQSIWYTPDGGTNWTDIEGNLSGSTGPSIRWASIFDVSGVTHYFLATSIGIFFTTTLDGNSTNWSNTASSLVGNVVCTMLDWRNSDNTLAVATHGRGIFTTQITSPAPVELTTFTATSVENKVILNWQTATEVNNYGFEIERSADKGIWEKVGFVEGHGNSNSTNEYSFVYYKILNGTVRYRLKQIDIDGGFEYSDAVEVETELSYKLSQNFPNPFNPSTIIEYSIPNSSNVRLSVYNSLGQKVATLVNKKQRAGKHEVQFDASNLSSGIYFYKLRSGKFVSTKKMILLR